MPVDDNQKAINAFHCLSETTTYTLKTHNGHLFSPNALTFLAPVCCFLILTEKLFTIHSSEYIPDFPAALSSFSLCKQV